MAITDFICLGVPKCGTTTLYDILAQHEDVVFPKTGKNAVYYKEQGGFAAFEHRYWNNIRKKPNKKYGFVVENWYMKFEPKQFAQDLPPDVKIIFIIRNPIARCFSDYKFSYAYRGLRGKDGREYYKYSHGEAFSRFVKRNRNRGHLMITCGKYYEKIGELYKYISPERIKVIILEETFEDSQKVYLDLFHFLNLNENKRMNWDIRANEGKYKTPNLLAGILYSELRVNFILKTLFWKYGINEKNELVNCILSSCVNILGKLEQVDKDHSTISKETEKMLYQYYLPDVRKMSKLLNKDLVELWFGEVQNE